MSKCRHMNKLYCEIIKIREKNGILPAEITDMRKSLHQVLHSSLQLKYGKVYEVETFLSKN